ncbi:MAG: hypothetical protein NT169_07250 [Chloroflexi bacterium]|nr:hypothetical protein [Chloroflexota bacterium]
MPETTLSAHEDYAQLQMVWPAHRLDTPPTVRLPPGYALRTYRRGDEPRFYKVMKLGYVPFLYLPEMPER